MINFFKLIIWNKLKGVCMKHRLVVISILTISFQSLYSVGPPTLPGRSVWKNAAGNVVITNTIESKVCNFSIANDFSGTFTVLDAVLSEMCIVASKAELLSTQIDSTEVNFNLDLSKACAIEDHLNLIQLNLESLDTNGTFTALDGLKQIVCSKIELLNNQLSAVQINITDLTSTELDHAATIASQLEVLTGEVMSINSILDVLNFDLKLNTACSLLEVIDGCLQTVESKVDLLDGIIPTGFVGTFTALDLNLAKACTIESLIDTVVSVSFVADLSNTFSALNELQEKMCTIESKVDGIDILIILSNVDLLDSKLDPLISKLSVLESEIDVLESKGDAAAGNPFFSLVDNAIQVLDQDCSILEVLNNNQMLEKSCTIESDLDAITTELPIQQSKLEVIDQELQTITSKICTVEMGNIAISKLCLVDSKLDVELNTSLTIESIIDSFIVSESNIDVLDDLGQTIFSKLCIVDLEVVTVCSKLDALHPELQTIDSKLAVISPVAQSNLDGLITIESRIDNVSFDQLVTNTLISKLCLIEGQVCTVASSVDLLGSLVSVLNMQAQELIGDFQETWTILQVIEDKLCTSESVLDSASNKLQVNLDQLDFSGVFTAIEAICQKEITVDGKVNTYESLTDAIVDIDFSGVFTVLEVIQSKICLADDLVQTISAGLEDVSDCLGFPIFNADLPLAISIPGRYYLAEDIDYAGTSDAITIGTDDVFLDLNGYTLNYTGVTASIDGVMISPSRTNIQVTNGAITNFTGSAIDDDSGNNLIFSHLNFANMTGNALVTGSSSRNIIVDNVNDSGSRMLCNLSGTNMRITKCFSEGATDDGIAFQNIVNCVVTDSIAHTAGGTGIEILGTSRNVLHQRLIANGCGALGLGTNVAGLDVGRIILDCQAIGNVSDGIDYDNTEGILMRNISSGNGRNGFDTMVSTNSYLAFNVSTENSDNNFLDESVNANTFLGNFAFNSTAVGDPNNTNYDFSGGASNITRKFVTVSQASSFSDRPTEWHNINMLP